MSKQTIYLARLCACAYLSKADVMIHPEYKWDCYTMFVVTKQDNAQIEFESTKQNFGLLIYNTRTNIFTSEKKRYIYIYIYIYILESRILALRWRCGVGRRTTCMSENILSDPTFSKHIHIITKNIIDSKKLTFEVIRGQ